METTFRLSYAVPPGEMPPDHGLVFHKLSEMLCRECGETCKAFLITSDADEYQTHDGPKIAWAFDGPHIFLRMADCKRLGQIDQISQFLKLFDMKVVESRLIQ